MRVNRKVNPVSKFPDSSGIETFPPTNFKLLSLKALGVSEFLKMVHKIFCSSSRKKLLQSKTQFNYL